MDVLQAIEPGDAGPLKLLHVHVASVRQGETAEDLLDAAYMERRESRAYQDVATVTSLAVKVAGQEAHLQVVRFRQEGELLYTGQVCFIRAGEKKENRLAYVLSLTAKASQKSSLIDVLRQVSQSLSLTDLTPVNRSSFELIPEPVTQLGASVRIPTGWFVYGTQSGLSAQVIDYARGLGSPMRMDLMVIRESGSFRPEDHVAQLKDRFAQTRAQMEQAGMDPEQAPTVEEVTDAKLGSVSGKAMRMRSAEGLTLRHVATRSYQSDTILYVLDVRAFEKDLEDKAQKLSRQVAQSAVINPLPTEEDDATSETSP
jgi:hypothetical protein